MRYFKCYSEEYRGDRFNHWGCSWWLFEKDNAGRVTRQIVVYDRGPVHCYSASHPQNEYGKLGDEPMNVADLGSIDISKEEFENAWEE
jgi:hypothetical protein